MEKRPQITIQDVYLGPLIYEKIQNEKNKNKNDELNLNINNTIIPSNNVIERDEIQYKEKLSENLIPSIIRNNNKNN
jgi:hypothetical protein